MLKYDYLSAFKSRFMVRLLDLILAIAELLGKAAINELHKRAQY